MTKVEKLVLFFKVVVGSVITGIPRIPHPPALVADTHKFFAMLYPIDNFHVAQLIDHRSPTFFLSFILSFLWVIAKKKT
jgi:hypothetical protein